MQKANDKLAGCVVKLRETKEALAQTAKGLSATQQEKDNLEKALADQWDTLQSKINQVSCSFSVQVL